MARSKRTAKAKAPARVGFFAQHQIHAKQAFDDIRQRPLGSLLTILVLALALTLPTTFYWWLRISPRWLLAGNIPRSSVLIC